MYAGSVKDTYTIGYGHNKRPSDYPKSSDACNFDVLKTPKEEGLQVRDVIHIKDMKTRREDCEKVVGDLLAKALITLTLQDIFKLEIYYRKARELIFNVHRPNISEPVISLKVYSVSPNSILRIS
jgi:hypothetical protein